MTLSELLVSQRREVRPHLDRAIWPLSSSVDETGRLCIGGLAVSELAAEFGTPAYVLDEEDFRARIRGYRAALPGVELIYAGRALLSAAVAGWAAEEGAGVEVCSGGELATALTGEVPPSNIVLNGTAKSAGELDDAVAAGVGRIVIDTPNEIALLAGRVRRRQRVLIRVIPDIDAVDQRFGFSLAGGQAAGAVKRLLGEPWLDLVGLHCQLGSQLADAALYGAAIRQILALMAEARDRHGVVLTELSLGGGHAVPYRSGEPAFNPRAFGTVIDAALQSACAQYDYPRPRIVIGPGRAIAARAGMTLYRVVAVKRRADGHTFVAVDGGMSDNPRLAPAGAKYTVALANRHASAATAPVTVVGRHCEAGDEIARDVELPADLHPGDLLAVACTGAYHYSMGSSCSVAGRPPLVAVAGGRARELVRRETTADLLARDRGWSGRSDRGE
ncbi:diaminopimelate decarboxylase [Mycobacterium sp. 1081908.1]|uniref:diaminopimelate decarboxylase n=1 Tax=Mycobacterium sp. 1081908.1 TaxID=1834066 RepID=UPI0007FBAFE4|nr:diaminopimelate decarboxylase [Mycobacterium sp. 1081908.1]OBK53990.1 diaminopimelate decarboxylase [Mycobacterium sp. 1081908.1]